MLLEFEGAGSAVSVVAVVGSTVIGARLDSDSLLSL